MRWVVEIVDRNLLRVGPRLARLHALRYERISRRGDDYHTIFRVAYDGHNEIALWRLMDKACERRRKLKSPGRLPVLAPRLREAQPLRVPSVRAGRDLVSQRLVLKWEVDGGILDGLTGQRVAYHARPQLRGDLLLFLRRQRQHDALGERSS